jgi:predicted nucleic acid-binding protein
MDRNRAGLKAVVDTSVIAYYLLGTPDFGPEAQKFWHQAGDLLAPALWEAELANVIWKSVRSGVLEQHEASKKLGLAARLGIHSVTNRSLWHGALVRTLVSGIAVYKTLFVELADRERVPLATFDEKLTKAFPDIARRPGELAE